MRRKSKKNKIMLVEEYPIRPPSSHDDGTRTRPPGHQQQRAVSYDVVRPAVMSVQEEEGGGRNYDPIMHGIPCMGSWTKTLGHIDESRLLF